MWPFARKTAANLYKCMYCTTYEAADDKIFFNMKDMSELIVSANSLADAQIELAKRIPLASHIYIHEIKPLLKSSI